MSLEPKTGGTDNHASWYFEADSNRVKFSLSIEGSVDLEFAKVALENAIERKNKAILYGDALSLDLILGGFKKETLNDFGRIVKEAESL